MTETLLLQYATGKGLIAFGQNREKKMKKTLAYPGKWAPAHVEFHQRGLVWPIGSLDMALVGMACRDEAPNLQGSGGWGRPGVLGLVEF